MLPPVESDLQPIELPTTDLNDKPLSININNHNISLSDSELHRSSVITVINDLNNSKVCPRGSRISRIARIWQFWFGAVDVEQ